MEIRAYLRHKGFFPEGFTEFFGFEENCILLCGSPFAVALLNTFLSNAVTGSSVINGASFDPGTINFVMSVSTLAAFPTRSSGKTETGDMAAVTGNTVGKSCSGTASC